MLGSFVQPVMLEELVNKRGIVLQDCMRCQNPLGHNQRCKANHATVPIYDRSFLQWRQNQFQLKQTLAKTGIHF